MGQQVSITEYLGTHSWGQKVITQRLGTHSRGQQIIITQRLGSIGKPTSIVQRETFSCLQKDIINIII